MNRSSNVRQKKSSWIAGDNLAGNVRLIKSVRGYVCVVKFNVLIRSHFCPFLPRDGILDALHAPIERERDRRWTSTGEIGSEKERSRNLVPHFSRRDYQGLRSFAVMRIIKIFCPFSSVPFRSVLLLPFPPFECLRSANSQRPDLFYWYSLSTISLLYLRC